MPLGAIEWQMDVPRFAALFAEGWIYDWNTCDWFCIKVLSRHGEAGQQQGKYVQGESFMIHKC